MMQLEADRMQNLQIRDDYVKSEREVIIEERRSRIDNNPSALFDEQLRTALFIHHPYGIPTIGWEHEMHGLGPDDARAFYNRWYAPNNAVVIVAGDITASELRPLAEKYYGPVPMRPVPPRQRVSEPEHVASARLEMKSPRVAQPVWSRSYLAPSYKSGDSQHAYALQVLADIIGGGATSRLYRSLVVEKQIALSAGAFYSPGSLDLTTFGYYASPRPGVSVADLEAAVEAEIKRVLDEGVGEDEVKRSATRMQAESVYAQDSLSGPANIFGQALTTGRSVADVEAWPERIGAVTRDEVNEAARAVILPAKAVTGVLLPQPTS
jgi:zinc protease